MMEKLLDIILGGALASAIILLTYLAVSDPVVVGKGKCFTFKSTAESPALDMIVEESNGKAVYLVAKQEGLLVGHARIENKDFLDMMNRGYIEKVSCEDLGLSLE